MNIVAVKIEFLTSFLRSTDNVRARHKVRGLGGLSPQRSEYPTQLSKQSPALRRVPSALNMQLLAPSTFWCLGPAMYVMVPSTFETH
jgi:hypothetical protein